MHTKPSDFSKFQQWSDTITCLYLCLLLGLLYYNNYLHVLGQFEAIYIIVLLLVLEIVKYLLFNQKPSILRKHYVKDLLRTIPVLFGTFVLFYVIAVLLGAPVFSDFQQTAIFSLLLNILGIMPCCLNFGRDTTINMLLTITQFDQKNNNDRFYNLMLIKLRLTIFGAWLGAIVVPLDWNRSWQKWPIPCCLGTLFGCIIAHFVTSFLQVYKRKFKRTGNFV